MKVKLFFTFLALSFICISAPLFGQKRVVDNIDYMRETNVAELEVIAGNLASLYNFNLIIVTEKDTGSAAPEEYAKSRYNSYGFGDNSDGILVLYVSETRKFHFYTSGRGAAVSKKIYFSRMEANLTSDILNKGLFVAFRSFAADLEVVLTVPPLKFDRHFAGLGIYEKNDERKRLETVAKSLVSLYGFNIIVRTELELGDTLLDGKIDSRTRGVGNLHRAGGKVEEYAERLYKAYGFGDDSDGYLLLYIIRTGEYCTYTSGRGRLIAESSNFRQLEGEAVNNLFDLLHDSGKTISVLVNGFEKILSTSAFTRASSASASGKSRLVDNSVLLSSDEAQNLKETLDRISKSYNFDIVIVTENSIGEVEPKDYAEEFYNLMGYGFGEEKDGCLFLQITESRDYRFSTYGRAVNIFTNDAFDKMMTNVREHLRNNNYNEAYLAIANNCEKFLALDAKGKTFRYSFFELYYYLFIAAAIGLAAGWFAGRRK